MAGIQDMTPMGNLPGNVDVPESSDMSGSSEKPESESGSSEDELMKLFLDMIDTQSAQPEDTDSPSQGFDMSSFGDYDSQAMSFNQSQPGGELFGGLAQSGGEGVELEQVAELAVLL